MKSNKIIKTIAMTLILILCINTVQTFAATKNIKNLSLTYQNTNEKYLNKFDDAKISTIYADDSIVKYLVEESDISYEIEYDLKNYVVTVNGKTYTFDDYQNAAIKEIEFKSNNIKTENSINGIQTKDSKNIITFLSEYKTIEKPKLTKDSTSIMSIQDSVGIMYDDAIPPTTGYGNEYFVGNVKKLNFKLGLTSALLTAAAAFFTSGNITDARTRVQGILQKAITAGIISAGTNYIAGGNAYYSKYQSHHKTLPATKERRVPYYEIGSYRFYEQSWTHYFWYSRPF